VKATFYVAIAMAIGLIVLLGYFLHLDLLANLRVVLLEWAVILSAVALLVGTANLFYVHWRKFTTTQPNGFYSAVLIISFVITLGVVGWFGPTHAYSMWIFNNIQVPIEGSLMALLTVLLAFAGVGLFRRKPNLMSIIFIGTAVLILFATGPLFGINLPGISELRAWIAQVPAVAGARGILLGVALGTIATGLRVLMGADRPYGG